MQNINPLLFKGIINGKSAFCGPQIVQIDITGKCNNNCVGCWVHSPYINNPPRDQNKELSFEFVKQLINELAKMGTQEIFLAGSGEPFLHPQIMQIISLIKEKGLKLNIITNALLLTQEKIKFLVDLGVEMLTASIWAGSGQSYIKTHPGKGSKDFYTIKNNLCFLNKLRLEKKVFSPKVKIYNVICNLNYRDIGKMIDFALDVGAQDIEFQLIDAVRGQTSFLALSATEINEVKDQILALQKREDLFFKDVSSRDSLKEEELKEFPGRFYKIPQEFLLNESIKPELDGTKSTLRSLNCKRGFSTLCGKDNPFIDELNNTMIFSFLKENCRLCRFFGLSCQVDNECRFLFGYLKIVGYGSFMHKLTSSGADEQKYEKEVIENYPCYTGWLYSRVLSTGEIIPCCKGVNKTLGNLYQKRFFSRGNFSSIWNSRAYRNFRFKAKTITKNNDYFKEVNCFKSCDHVSSNVMLDTILKDNSRRIQEAKIKKREHPLIAKNIIKVAASSFLWGNLNISTHNFGKGIVIDGGKGFGFAEYEIFIPETSDYEIWVYYASLENRPIDLYLDGVLLAKDISIPSSGGWNSDSLSWLYLKTINISKEKHNFRIYTDGFIPHIHTFVFVKGSRFSRGSINNLLTLGMYPKPKLFSVIFNKIKSLGAKEVFFRAAKRLYLKKPLSDYLDILGIFNGRHAFKGPFHVQIDLTDHCNNNCLACWCNSPLLEEKKHTLKQKHILSFELAKELIDDLSSMGTREIYFSGAGEPFCHPHIMDILAYAKKRGFVCYINTNFTLLDKVKIDKLIDLGIDHLTVSIWAATAEIYAQTHPNKTEDSFLQIVENLKYLNSTKQNKPYIKLYNVIFNKNYHELIKMVDIACQTGSESLEYALVDTIPGKTEGLLLNSDQIKRLQQDVDKLSLMLDQRGQVGKVTLFRFDVFRRRVSSSADLVQATYDRNIIDKIPCYIGWCFARILPNGEVNSCLKAHRIPVGNLYLDEFRQIWNGDKQIFFRNKTLVYKKSDVFFRLIGNDPDVKEAGCYKSCDDIGRNVYMHGRIMSLTLIERLILKFIARSKILPYKKVKKCRLQNDLVLAGIQNGRRAFIGPEQVTIDLTNRCNQKCIGCWLYSPFLENKPDARLLRQELDLVTVKSLINSLADMGVKRVRFTGGGEPFMHPAIMEILAYTKHKGLICSITTSFLLLDKKQIEELISLGIDELAISLWAATEQSYQRMHPLSPGGVFSKIKENILFLTQQKKNKPFVTICNVLCNLNFQEIEQMFDFTLDLGADGVYFTLLDALAGTDSLLLNQEQREFLLKGAELCLRKWEKLDKEKKIKLDNFDGFILRLKHGKVGFGEYDLNDINEYPCYAGWIFSRILADGSVAPCCRGVKKVMGNINKEDFYSIWHKQEYNLFRAKARYLDKTDPYFSQIGCLKMCDNLMHNKEINQRINGE